MRLIVATKKGDPTYPSKEALSLTCSEHKWKRSTPCGNSAFPKCPLMFFILPYLVRRVKQKRWILCLMEMNMPWFLFWIVCWQIVDWVSQTYHGWPAWAEVPSTTSGDAKVGEEKTWIGLRRRWICAMRTYSRLPNRPPTTTRVNQRQKAPHSETPRQRGSCIT